LRLSIGLPDTPSLSLPQAFGMKVNGPFPTGIFRISFLSVLTCLPRSAAQPYSLLSFFTAPVLRFRTFLSTKIGNKDLSKRLSDFHLRPCGFATGPPTPTPPLRIPVLRARSSFSSKRGFVVLRPPGFRPVRRVRKTVFFPSPPLFSPYVPDSEPSLTGPFPRRSLSERNRKANSHVTLIPTRNLR